MRCFYHLDAEALGVCKNCQRGLCRDCLFVVENGLACKDRCEARVQSLNRTLDAQIAGTRYLNRIFLPAAGLIGYLIAWMFITILLQFRYPVASMLLAILPALLAVAILSQVRSQARQAIEAQMSQEGRTDLMRAVAAGQPEAVQALLDAGADVNARDRDGRTALMLAAARGHRVIVQALLSKGATVQIRDQWGMTALQWAQGAGHREIVQLLQDTGAAEE